MSSNNIERLSEIILSAVEHADYLQLRELSENKFLPFHTFCNLNIQ